MKLVEWFFSVQGEGWWAGTQMLFVRFPGCPVGGVEGICTNWDQTEFACDTGKAQTELPLYSAGVPVYDYNQIRDDKSPSELVNLASEARVAHLLITGGEPMKHKLGPLVTEAYRAGIQVHIETSGTVLIPPGVKFGWVTVSPKKGWLPEVLRSADELKLLVTSSTDQYNLDWWRQKVQPGCKLCIQALENQQYTSNLRQALALVAHRPEWRFSSRFHRQLSIR